MEVRLSGRVPCLVCVRPRVQSTAQPKQTKIYTSENPQLALHFLLRNATWHLGLFKNKVTQFNKHYKKKRK